MDEFLKIHVDRANEDEIERGINAARKVFCEAGDSISYVASICAEARDKSGDLTDEEKRIVELYHRADSAAVLACCHGWDVIPKSAELFLGTAGGGVFFDSDSK